MDLPPSRIQKTPHIHYVALSRVRSVDKFYILNFNEQALAVDERVVQEMDRMRREVLLKLCYLPVYLAKQNQVRVMFNNGRSPHKHFDDVKIEPQI